MERGGRDDSKTRDSLEMAEIHKLPNHGIVAFGKKKWRKESDLLVGPQRPGEGGWKISHQGVT